MIFPLIADRREEVQALISEFQTGSRHAFLAIPDFDVVNGLCFRVLHCCRDRLLDIDGKTVHASANEKIRALVLGIATYLVDVTFPVPYM